MEAAPRVRQAFEVVGGKWVSDVLDRLSGGPLRYSELQLDIEGVASSVLTRTLRRMERDGLITRRVRPAAPPEVEYSATPLGGSLDEPLTALVSWAELHFDRSSPPGSDTPGGASNHASRSARSRALYRTPREVHDEWLNQQQAALNNLLNACPEKAGLTTQPTLHNPGPVPSHWRTSGPMLLASDKGGPGL